MTYNYVFGAVLGGIGGTIAALALGHVDPEFAFWTTSGEFVFVAILAGYLSVPAVFVAAIILELVRSFSNLYFPNTWQLALGDFPAGRDRRSAQRLGVARQPPERKRDMSQVVLEVRDVQKSFGAVTAAKDISVTVPEGAVYSLIGTNGAGKTTFVNMVTGYIKPDAGTITFGNRNIVGMAPRQITRMGIHRSFQIAQLCNELTVEENMLVADAIHSRSGPSFLRRAHDAEMRERAVATLERFHIAEHRNRLIPELSGGVKKLLDIAMAMAGETQIMLLDEPTSGVATDEKFPDHGPGDGCLALCGRDRHLRRA